MKCNICDKDLNEKEISWNKEIDNFEPCGHCLEIALDAAYSDGFARPDEDDMFVVIEDEDDRYGSAFTVMLSTLGRGERDDD
ncbi:MAG: hypothetical protein Unbinned2691contig1000_30 [Prokaryotic dsDNA virus sp.]|nr:MAG: hypothetical protein Unbinned2691contig1000_30 [Prokaryotic dsDNA virus sp.]|tara:strand:+ start:1389 stop:1634 length:246 start_codon:yes stop_codon:yes gene_type:complete